MADKKTSPKVAKKASKILRDDRYSNNVHSVAGSDLGQAEGNQSKKGSKKGATKKGSKKR